MATNPSPPNLIVGIDAAYIDDPLNPSVKQHQIDHGVIHACINALADPTVSDPYGARTSIQNAIDLHLAAPDPHGGRAYTDTQLQNYTPTLSLKPVALSGDALDVAGEVLEFNYNTATSRYDYIGNVLRSAEAFQVAGRTKVFVGPASAPPENSTTAVGPAGTAIAITPVFRKYDEHRIRL